MKKYGVTVLAAKDKQPAEILVHGPIGKSFWSEDGISGKDFTNALNAIPVGTKIIVGVNSQGGAVGEGLAIYNAIQRRSEDVTCRIDGYALSIASFFPLAASKVISPKSSIWMIHEAWMPTEGNKRQLRKEADMLETHDVTLIGAYVKKTGKPQSEIVAAMESETWLDGSKALAWGLADETTDDDVSGALDALDFAPIAQSNFKNTPQRILACVKNKPQAATPPQSGTNPEKNKHMKEQIVALLTERKIAFDANASAEELLKVLAKAQTVTVTANQPATPAAASATDNVVAELQKQIAAERKSRITAEVNRRAENRVANDKLAWWIENALKDEAGTLAQIDALPVNKPAGDVVGAGSVIILADTPLEKIRNEHKTPEARHRAIGADFNSLFADACARDTRQGKTVMGLNTYSGTLVTSFLMDGSLTPLQNRWAALRAFALDSSTDPYKPLATGVLKNPTAGATTQTDATNFESGNSTVAPISVTMHQYTQSFAVSNLDLNNGLRMQDLVTINTANFANKIIEVATAPITVANFTGTPLTSAPGSFGFSDAATLQGQLKKSPIKNLILDGEYQAQLANTPGFFQGTGVVGGSTSAWKAFGWDLIALNTDWTGAGAAVRGFACNPQAIVGITGTPLAPPNIPGGTLSLGTFTVPDLNITVAMYSWFNTGTRTMWYSYDVMAGFALGDATAGIIVKSS